MLRAFSRPESKPAEGGIEPGRLQFIEKHFGSYLQGPERAERIRSIQQALFIEGRAVAAVLHEFAQKESAVKVIAVTSGKGGVGKTTVSVNLAVALAKTGRRVLLFDADLGMANAHIFAGVNPQATLFDIVQGRASLAQIVTPGPAGLHLACGASGVAQLADLPLRALESLCLDLAAFAKSYDVLLLDTGAGISAQVLKFLAIAAEIVVVATPNMASILDAYGVIKVAREARLTGQIQILVNQTVEAGEAEAVYHRLRGCAERFLQFTPASLGALSQDRAFEEANQRRSPLALSAPGNVNALRLAEIAARLFAAPPPARSSAPAAPPAACQTAAA